MNEQDKKSLELAVNEALKNGFDETGNWNGNKFALVLKDENNIAEANKYIKEYLSKIINKKITVSGIDGAPDKADLISALMDKSPGRNFSEDRERRSGDISKDGVFQYITSVKPYDPKTKISFEFEFDSPELTDNYSKALKVIKDKGVSIGFFPQMADVDDKNKNDGYNLTKLKDLGDLVRSTIPISAEFSEQELAVVRMYDLALRRSLTVANEVHDQDKINKIKAVLGNNDHRDAASIQTWNNARDAGLLDFKERNGVLVSDLAVLGTDMNDDSKKRATTSEKVYTIKRQEGGLVYPPKTNVSYAGIIKKDSDQVENPQGVLGEQRNRSKKEIDIINGAITTLQGTNKDDPYQGFNDWVIEEKEALKKPQDKEKEPDRSSSAPAKPKMPDNKKQEKNITDTSNKGTGHNTNAVTKRKDEPKEEPRFIFSKPVDKELDPNRIGLNYVKSKIKKPSFKEEMFTGNSAHFSSGMDYFVNFFMVPGLSSTVTTVIALFRSGRFLGKETQYLTSKLKENDQLNKTTTENLGRHFHADIISKVDPANPTLDNIEIVEINIDSKGERSVKKHNKETQENYKKIKEQIVEIFSKELDLSENLTPEQKHKLTGQFSDKLSESNLILTITENSNNKTKVAKRDGFIEFYNDPKDAKSALQNGIMEKTRLLMSNSLFSNKNLSPSDIEGILKNYLTESGQSDVLDISLKNNGQIVIGIKENADLQQLKSFNRFMKTEIFSPIRESALPDGLRTPLIQISSINRNFSHIVQKYDDFKQKKDRTPGILDENDWTIINRKIETLEKKYGQLDIKEESIGTLTPTYTLDHKDHTLKLRPENQR